MTYDPIKEAQACIADAIEINESDVVAVNNFLEHLSGHGQPAVGNDHFETPATSEGTPPPPAPPPLRYDSAAAAAPGTGGAPLLPPPPRPLSPPPPPPLEEERSTYRHAVAHLSPGSESGRKLLVEIALANIEKADQHEMQHDRVAVARAFHSASVYLEVLKSFHVLPPELESSLRYAKFRTYQNSHLLENIVQEHLEKDSHIQDSYIMHKDKELGRGTYGRVVPVTHRANGRQYACKVVNVMRMEPYQVSKLYSEISVMREVDHPHIVRLREVYYSKRYIYMVMDLMRGGELFHLVTSNPGDCATEAQIVKMITDMLSAVRYMHKVGWVHRDLKLENWLLESPGDVSSLKLIDFGLSKHFVASEYMHQAVGSTYYVAPEVLLGSYTEKCDLWSMGVIAYMMLTGAPPFWGSSDALVRSKIIQGRYSMPPELFKNVSAEACDFIQQLLTVDPDRRLSAEQALAHPWLNGSNSLRGPSYGPLMRKTDLAVALRQFRRFSDLRKLVLEVVAYGLAPEEMGSLRETFKNIDQDNSGTISLAEMAQALEGQISPEELQQLYDAVNINSEEEVNYNEFIAATMWTRLQLDEERLQDAFAALDRQGKGYLTAEGIKQVVGVDWDEKEVQEMIEEADYNHDGRVYYNEFATLWKEHALERHHKPVTVIIKKMKRTIGVVRTVISLNRMAAAGASLGNATAAMAGTGAAAARGANPWQGGAAGASASTASMGTEVGAGETPGFFSQGPPGTGDNNSMTLFPVQMETEARAEPAGPSAPPPPAFFMIPSPPPSGPVFSPLPPTGAGAGAAAYADDMSVTGTRSGEKRRPED